MDGRRQDAKWSLQRLTESSEVTQHTWHMAQTGSLSLPSCPECFRFREERHGMGRVPIWASEDPDLVLNLPFSGCQFLHLQKRGLDQMTFMDNMVSGG